MRSQHRRPEVDDIVASFVGGSPALQPQPAPADVEPSVSPSGSPDVASSVPADVQETEPGPELRVHRDATPSPPPRPSRTRKPRRKVAPQAASSSHTLVSHIPQRAFFKYYNSCQDEILRLVPSKTGKLLLNRLFRLTYGFNRNWCRVSLESLANHVGAQQTHHIRLLLRQELSRWVFIIARGGRRGGSLWVLNLGDTVPHPRDLDGVKIISEEDTFGQPPS